jgi:protein with PEP-CTERM/exosortase system signal
MSIKPLKLRGIFLVLAGFGAVSARADLTLLPDNASWTVLGQYDSIVPNSSPTTANFPTPGSLNFAGWTPTSGGLTGGTYSAAFGFGDGLSDATPWVPNTTLDLKTTINLTGIDLSSLQFNLAIDNDLELFVNGTQVDLSGLQYNEKTSAQGGGGIYYRDGQPLWVSGSLPEQDLQSGVNTIEVIAVDRGGGTYFDMNVTGTAGTSSVPDSGSTAGLLAASLAGLAVAARRVRRLGRV